MLTKLSLRDFPLLDRPRERLVQKGPSALSEVELIAVLLGSGNKNIGVLNIASELIIKVGGLNGLSRLSFSELVKFQGIGKSKAAQLSVCFEISRRIVNITESKEPSRYINNAINLYHAIKPFLLHKTNEVFVVVSLDSRKKLISVKEVSVGTVNQTLVHAREVFKESILCNASYIAVAHNHPSGDSTPSYDDITITKRLTEASKIIGIPLIDHLIVSDGKFQSIMRDDQLGEYY